MASDSSQTRAPHLPSPASPLSHLAQLAIAIFEDVCHNVSVHPARDFKETVQNVVSLIVPKQMAPEMIDAALDGTADQNLWDIMADTGVDWAGLFPGPDLDFGSTWPAQPLSIP